MRLCRRDRENGHAFPKTKSGVHAWHECCTSVSKLARAPSLHAAQRSFYNLQETSGKHFFHLKQKYKKILPVAWCL